MGLGLYRDRLLHIGGMLRTEVEDGTWSCMPVCL